MPDWQAIQHAIGSIPGIHSNKILSFRIFGGWAFLEIFKQSLIQQIL